MKKEQVVGEGEKQEDQGTCRALLVYSWQAGEPVLISFQKKSVTMQEKEWYNTVTHVAYLQYFIVYR